MGLNVSAKEAARLVGRSERAIRQWIASGKLRAQPTGVRKQRPGVGPTQWRIDIEELAKVPGIVLDRAYLAELEARAAQAEIGPSLVERVARLERELEDVKARLEAIAASQGQESEQSGQR